MGGKRTLQQASILLRLTPDRTACAVPARRSGLGRGSRGEHDPVLFEPRERNKIKILLRSQWIYDIIWDVKRREPFKNVFIVS